MSLKALTGWTGTYGHHERTFAPFRAEFRLLTVDLKAPPREA